MKAATLDHPELAATFTSDNERTHWHDQALWFVRAKRDRAASSIPEWEYLRELASKVKQHTIANLPELLEKFEQEATRLGARVHWARTAEEHNQIVLQLLREHHATHVVKSKSMLTEECHLNPFLERNGIEVIDTDLGERIVQLRHEPPSHIVLPAIHIKKEEVGTTFHEHLGTPAGLADPQALTEAARVHLRERFLDAEVGITGANFAVAETGGIVVCTNEGNADLGAVLPNVHIVCVGIEKLVPRLQDLAVYTRLLARSATGQPITAYTSHFHGPRPGGKLEIVLVDNGRSTLRDDEEFRDALHCIRCGACMNTCPVYRRSGGHSYQSTVPGPIGSVLSPKQAPASHQSLPFACSLCGSCTDVCPVKIPLHHQLLALRRQLADTHHVAASKRWSMSMCAWLMSYPRLFSGVGALARWSLAHLPRFVLYGRHNSWGRARELPDPPSTSFRAWYAAHRGHPSRPRPERSH